ncbi:MAG TPA: hypothetical protein VG166_14835 [Caulobacteraceae bacterium]|jgi:hypothetical protein|nr:hypothetical protein [Caulobacteraceae bacterium]
MRLTQSPVFAVVAMAALAALPAAAAKEAASPKVIQSLLDCRKLGDNTERLACYDRAAAEVQSATTSGDLVSIDREQRRAARRQAFGFTLPTLGFLDRGEKGADRLTAQVAEATQDPYGKWVIRLDDGAVWVQTEPEGLARRPRKGSTVVLSRGALGGYFMTIDGQGAGKAKRES